jgi:hypothetical protein
LERQYFNGFLIVAVALAVHPTETLANDNLNRRKFFGGFDETVSRKKG